MKVLTGKHSFAPRVYHPAVLVWAALRGEEGQEAQFAVVESFLVEYRLLLLENATDSRKRKTLYIGLYLQSHVADVKVVVGLHFDFDL